MKQSHNRGNKRESKQTQAEETETAQSHVERGTIHWLSLRVLANFNGFILRSASGTEVEKASCETETC